MLHEIYIKNIYIIKKIGNSVEATTAYIEVLLYWAFSCIKMQHCGVTLMKNNSGLIIIKV